VLSVNAGGSGLCHIERRHVEVGHASGQGFAALAHQVQRGRAQQQKLPAANARLPVVVDDAAQDFKHTGCAVNLVQDDQLALLGAQIGVGIFQPQAVSRALQVQIHRTARPVNGQRAGQGGLAHLARPQQHHGGGLKQFLADGGFELAAFHH
jgi:hypothetical protein